MIKPLFVRRLGVVVCLSACTAIVGACGDSTAPLVPAAIQVTAGDHQTGAAGSPLAIAPSVKVVTASGQPVPRVEVAFTSSPPNGSVTGGVQMTDAAGIATVTSWTLGTTSGPDTLVVSVDGIAPVAITAITTAGPATSFTISSGDAQQGTVGATLSAEPAVRVADTYGNGVSGVVVSFALVNGGSVARPQATTDADGVASAGTWKLGPNAGPQLLIATASAAAISNLRLQLTATALPDPAQAQCPGNALALDFQPGQSLRFLTTSSALPRCLDFSATRNAGQQYMMLFENVSPRGSYESGLFPGTPTDDGHFNVSVTARGPASGQVFGRPQANASSNVPAEAVDRWDFGGKPAYEIQPKMAGRAPRALVKQSGAWISANSIMSAPNVGDTVRVLLEGIARLNIPQGYHPAVVRYVDANIIIAEDVRFTTDTTFKRSNGSRNTPIAEADLQQIATEYASYAKVQADRLFDGRYNSATETDPGRPIAVHTLMYADNIWGYTYANTNYFAWDYWVNSADGKTKDIYQHAQRNADDLFMHEIAHMRHWGMLERAGRTGQRGNQWLVEGFARFSERLPIDARLLGSQDFGRTSNVVLPYNMEWYPRFFMDEIPSYWSADSNMFGGYSASAFVFDYFADQVAATGANWRSAITDLLLNGGNESNVNGVVNNYLGIDFGTLFTRARIALYTDDLGGSALPPWTQYLQLQLRASRTASSLAYSDPHNAWPTIVAGAAFTDNNRIVAPGGAFGYIIDDATNSDAHVEIDPVHGTNGVLTLVRIR